MSNSIGQISLHRLTHGSLTLVVSNLSSAALGFVLSLSLGRGLGEVGFGRWTFCLAWASALTMLSQFGLNTLVTREAARDKARGNQFLIGGLVAQLLFSLLLGSGLLFAPNLGFDSESSAGLRLTILLIVAGTVYSSLAALFRAFEWMLPILWLNVGGLHLQLPWPIQVLRSGGGVRELITVAGEVQVIQLVAALGLWWFKLRPVAGPLRVEPPAVRQMVRQALPFAVAGLVGALQLRSSPLMLGYLRGAAEVGWFGAAARFSESAKLIPNGIAGAVFPALAASGSLAAGLEAHENLFRMFNRVLVVTGFAAAIGLSLFSRLLLGLTYGPDFLQAVWPLIWLALGLIPNLINGGLELYLYANGDETYVTWLGIAGVIVQVIASLPLILLFGASGAAIAMGLGEAAIWFPLRRRVKIVQLKDRP
jgi:O-antigen/teichoic acid export membrane protein